MYRLVQVICYDSGVKILGMTNPVGDARECEKVTVSKHIPNKKPCKCITYKAFKCPGLESNQHTREGGRF